jgi:hypothetical protein
MSTTSFAPRINHVAISVDADVLDDEGRAALLDFYSEVFGWTEELRQFVYLLPAKDEFMVTPGMDHFGMEVSSKEELLEILERVTVYQGKDDRVSVTDVGTMVTQHKGDEHTLTNVYIKFLIPLWIELQHIERRAEH